MHIMVDSRICQVKNSGFFEYLCFEKIVKNVLTKRSFLLSRFFVQYANMQQAEIS